MAINHEQTVFQGKIIRVATENVTLPDHSVCDMEIVYHPGGAAVVALNTAQEICLLKQYRHAVRDWLWELPAGKIEADADAALTARRELAEEAGVVAEQWQALGVTQSSPGIFTEVIHLYLAQQLTPVEQQLEHGEVLEVHWLPFDMAVERVMAGEINDAKTCLGILCAARYLG